MKFSHDFDSCGQVRRRRVTSQLEKPMADKKVEELSAVGKQAAMRGYLAVDYYFDHLKKTVASAPSGGTALGEKVKACAEQNISATQEFVRELSYAKDIQDMLRIQMEFMRSQMETFGEQAKELGVAFFEAAAAPAKPPQSR
jgi:Phasin protein